MNPDIFPILKADSAVTALLGANPLRVYPWASAPEKPQAPYATYGVFNGNPENYQAQAPDITRMGTQIDIWAKSEKSAHEIFDAINAALNNVGHLINYQTVTSDNVTGLYNARMEFDFWQ